MPRRVWGGGAEERAKKLKSWSYSTWGQYKKCPRKVYFSKIKKLPDPIGKAGQRGIVIHEVAEKYVKGMIDAFPAKGPGKDLVHFVESFDRLKNSPSAKAELDFTFTVEWQQTHWRDWDNAWVRMKIDAFERVDKKTIRVIDYKTGQRRDYEAQLELYGLGGFKAHPEVETVLAEIWYLDEGDTHDPIEIVEFHRHEEDALQKLWEKRVDSMMNDTEYRPSPSSECSWCPFSKRKGGPCEAG